MENIITRRVAGMNAGGQGFSTLRIFNSQEIRVGTFYHEANVGMVHGFKYFHKWA